MHDPARLAYAQARVQGRHSTSPGAAFWRGVDASRDFEHVLELIRGSPYRKAVLSVSAQTDVHALERLLRDEWCGACDEIAGWYPPDWRAAFLWMRWVPWLPSLTWLAPGREPPAWMADQPLLGALVAAEDRAAALDAGPLAPLAGASGTGGIAAAWREHWRGLWRPLPAREARGLERLDAALALRLLQVSDRRPIDFETVLEDTGNAVLRLFRRHAGTPVAGLAYLALGALERLHLRAALSAARLFGRRADE